MMERISVISVDGPEPFTLKEAKDHLRVQHPQDDTYIQELITVARDMVERLTKRAIPQQKLKLTLDYFPNNNLGWWDGMRDGALAAFQRRALDIGVPPCISVQELATYDLANVRNIYAASNYYLDNSDPNIPGRICLNVGSIWPVNLRRNNAVEVLFTAGYATGAIPAGLKLGIKMLLAHLYANRGEADDVALNESGAYNFLRQFIVHRTGTSASRGDRERAWT